MASSSTLVLLLLLASSLVFQAALAEIVCEQLPNVKCAFAIASSGKRCLLETYPTRGGFIEYQCRTSEVIVDKMAGYIETDQCVTACGLDRKSVGISSDSLLESHFTAKLCSAPCYGSCPNIADLFFNLAAGEGVFLPDLCEAQRSNPHRAMLELLSSGDAPSPVSSQSSNLIADAPASAPM